MKIEIDINDIWPEEQSLEEALVEEIRSATTRAIIKNIENQVQTQIEKKATEFIQARLSVIINDKLDECINNGVLETGSGSRKTEISIEDYIKDLFMKNNGWSNPDRQIERIASDFGKELKIQYNNAFANKIVHNMKEQGFLKDDITKMLLSDS